MPYSNWAGLANAMVGVSRLQQGQKALAAQQQQQVIVNEINTAKEYFRLSKEPNQGDADALQQYNQGLKSLYNARKLGGRKDIGEFTPITLQQFRPGRKIRNSAAGRAFNLINQTDMTSVEGLQGLEGKLYNLGAELNRDLTEKGLPVPQTGIFSSVNQGKRMENLRALAGRDKFMTAKAGEQIISKTTGLPVGQQVPFKPTNVDAVESIKRQLATKYSKDLDLDAFVKEIKKLESTTPQVQAAAFGPETEKIKAAGAYDVESLKQLNTTDREYIKKAAKLGAAEIMRNPLPKSATPIDKRKLRLQTRRLGLDYEKFLVDKGWDNEEKIIAAVLEYNKQLQKDIEDKKEENNQLNNFWRK